MGDRDRDSRAHAGRLPGDVPAFDARYAAPRRSVTLVAGDDPGLVELIGPRWDRYRRTRVGELARTDDRHRVLAAGRGKQAFYAIHDDGFACWKVTPDWSEAPPKHELRVLDLAASTVAARDALWSTILSIDLVGPIDDPLAYLVSNPRAVSTRGITDMLWLHVLDVPAVFGRRTYGVDDDIVTTSAAPAGRWGRAGVHARAAAPTS